MCIKQKKKQEKGHVLADETEIKLIAVPVVFVVLPVSLWLWLVCLTPLHLSLPTL